jgi:hypothetical protein
MKKTYRTMVDVNGVDHIIAKIGQPQTAVIGKSSKRRKPIRPFSQSVVRFQRRYLKQSRFRATTQQDLDSFEQSNGWLIEHLANTTQRHTNGSGGSGGSSGSESDDEEDQGHAPSTRKKHPPFNKTITTIKNTCRYRPRCSRTNTTTDVPPVGLAAMCSVATVATWSTTKRVCPRTPGPTTTNRSNGRARHALKNKKNKKNKKDKKDKARALTP